MNTIAALIPTNPTAAEQTVEDLADLFRASLSRPGELVSLEEEFEIVRLYERMERLRLGDRLSVEWDVDGVAEDIRLPGLCIQPLVENAIYHGIEPSPAGGAVHIEASTRDGFLHVAVSNPVTAGRRQGAHAGNRVALDNIRQRLALAYGSASSMDVAGGGESFVVTLRIPVDN